MTPLARIAKLLSFAWFYLWDVIRSNVRVAYDVLTPRHRMKPGIIAVPLGEMTDRQLFLLANLLTMTPGSLTLDVSSDRRTLYVHAMYVNDPEELRREVQEEYEKRIREVF